MATLFTLLLVTVGTLFVIQTWIIIGQGREIQRLQQKLQARRTHAEAWADAVRQQQRTGRMIVLHPPTSQRLRRPLVDLGWADQSTPDRSWSPPMPEPDRE